MADAIDNSDTTVFAETVTEEIRVERAAAIKKGKILEGKKNQYRRAAHSPAVGTEGKVVKRGKRNKRGY